MAAHIRMAKRKQEMFKRILIALVVSAVGVGGIALGLRVSGLSFGEAVKMRREAINERNEQSRLMIFGIMSA